MDANSPDHIVAIYHGHSFAEFRRGDRAFLTCGPASHDDQVVLNRMHQPSSAWFMQSFNLQW
jgi:hypothetical protein